MISISIIIIVIIAKSVILIRYLCKIKKNSYKKYQKSSFSSQLKKEYPESVNHYAINENIIQEPNYLNDNSDNFYDKNSEFKIRNW